PSIPRAARTPRDLVARRAHGHGRADAGHAAALNPPNLRAIAAARDGTPIASGQSRHDQDEAHAGTSTGQAAIVETRCNGSRWRGHVETCTWYVPPSSPDQPARHEPILGLPGVDR